MDNQQLFNLVVSIAGFLAVFVFYQVMQRLQRLEDELKALPRDYVTKDDYRADIKEVKEILRQIFDKLDAKADK
jgi:hypothetical protein